MTLNKVVLAAALYCAAASNAYASSVCVTPDGDTVSTSTGSSRKFALALGDCAETVQSVVVQADNTAQGAPFSVGFVSVDVGPDLALMLAMSSSNAAARSVEGRTPLESLAAPMRELGRSGRYDAIVQAAAQEYDLDPQLLHAVIHVESRGNLRALSHKGARGLMQLMPATARRFGVADARRLDDADVNIRAGAAYLRVLKGLFGGDLRLVLAAYNAGEGAVMRYGRRVPPYRETTAYVRNVLARYASLSGARG